MRVGGMKRLLGRKLHGNDIEGILATESLFCGVTMGSTQRGQRDNELGDGPTPHGRHRARVLAH
jgi:hypothetical protein